ncbi:MAG: hypothetical protein ACRC68_19295, partial [Clostridium sp.]
IEMLDYQGVLNYPAEWIDYQTPIEIVVDNKTYKINSKDVIINKNIASVKITDSSIVSFDSDEILVKWSEKNIEDKEFNTSIKREDVLRSAIVRDKAVGKISTDKLYPTIETSETDKAIIGRELYKKYIEMHKTNWFFNLLNGVKAEPLITVLDSKINKVDLEKEGKNVFTVSISYDVKAFDENLGWYAGNGGIGEDNWIIDKFCFVDIEKIGENKYRIISSYTG